MLLYLHAGLMISGLILMAAGITVARVMRKRHWWLRGHRALGACGSFSVIAGAVTAVFMVAGSGGPHFQVLHAWMGAIVALSATVTPVLGLMQFIVKGRRAEVREAHRWAGAVTLIFLALNILSGLVLAGILPDMRSF